MRRIIVVTYDISNPKRLRKVFRTLRGFGDHLQLSVFRCDLDSEQRVRLAGLLSQIIEPSEDQVIFVDLGPADGRSHRLEVLGRPVRAVFERGSKVF